jgi:type II secretory pathway predicted ATPase ExeA
MCNGGQNKFSKTTVDRLFKGTTTDFVVDRMRPVIAAALVEYLECRGFMPTEIEAELSELFDPKEYIKMIANRCPLSPEAVRHFGLNRDPFDVDHLPTAGELYTNPEIESVVARLKDAVLYQRFVAVIGGVGTGKTLLKLRVAHELEEVAGKTKLLYPEFFDMEEVTVHGIANKILAELGQKIPQNKEARVTRIREVLTQMQQEGIGVAIVLDEAHRLRDKVISSLKNFWEMTNGRSSRLLGVILYGQPAFVDSRLRDVRFKEIRQRVQIIEMPVFNSGSPPYKGGVAAAAADGVVLSSTAASYIAHRLKIAGGSIDTLFEPKAVERICINAQTPLAIGNLTNEALMAAYECEEKHVTASLEFFKKLSTGQQVLGMRKSAA